MSAETALRQAYQEWRRFAESEGEAIRTRNWTLLSACQDALRLLQPRILSCTDTARAEWSRLGLDPKVREGSLRPVVSELVELERRNCALLTEAREATQVQLDELAQTSRTLRRVQRSYGPTRPAVWTSFS